MKKKAAAALLAGTLALTAAGTAAPASADTYRLDLGSSVVDVPVPDGLGPILNQLLPSDANGALGSASGLLEALNNIIAAITGGTGGGTGTVGSNGVASFNVTLGIFNDGFGGGRELGPDLYSTGFRPEVRWEARDRSNAKISTNKCQMEISFPGTDQATYKTSSCSGNVKKTTPKYNKAGRYSIVVLDKVSGKSTTKTFTVE